MNKKISFSLLGITCAPLKIKALDYVAANQFEELQELLIQNLDKAGDILVASPEEGPDKGINIAWLLVLNKQFNLLEKLIGKGVITSEILAASPKESAFKGINVVFLLLEEQKYTLLGTLIEKDLITPEILSPVSRVGVFNGVTLVLLLAYQNSMIF